MLSEYELLQLKELFVDPTDKDSDIKPEHIQELAKYLRDHSWDKEMFPEDAVEVDGDGEPVLLVRVNWNWEEEESHFSDPRPGFSYKCGDTDFDTNHRGLWGSGTISYGMDEESLTEVAKEMLEELVSAAFQ